MTDQPTPRKDETPERHEPQPYLPPQESEVPAPPAPPAGPHFQEPDYGQHQGRQQGRAAPDYGQPGGPYGATPYGTAYGAPGQEPYGAQGQQFGQQQGQQYAQPGSPYNAYGQPAYYGMPPEPKGLSIASMCCGIAAFVGLGFFILPQIAAVILGHIALKREPGGRGMAIAGLVMGYVGIALTALVILIVTLAIGSARYTGYGV